jgi:asparagine synthase (glutamine-hydrolysing)
MKLHNGQGKYIFKRALEQVLPADVLTRKKKGFSMPVAEWFRGELKDVARAAIVDSEDGILDRRFLTECWKQHQRGQRDWSALLWAVLMFRSWQGVNKAA